MAFKKNKMSSSLLYLNPVEYDSTFKNQNMPGTKCPIFIIIAGDKTFVNWISWQGQNIFDSYK